ncbi:unnamed protein product, partial [Rotaria socialis]
MRQSPIQLFKKKRRNDQVNEYNAM